MNDTNDQKTTIGILMLDTQFPRILGDIGNSDSWPFPVLYKVVKNASPEQVVCNNASGLLDNFIDAGQDLIAQGAKGVATSCGFLSLFHEELSSRLNVPVASSSLQQVPWVQSLLPSNKKVGILTISKTSLSDEHLIKAGVPLDTPIAGTENGQEFSRVILNDEPTLNVDLAKADIFDSAQQLLLDYPQTGAIVLECTNMSPYAAGLNEALGIPIYSSHTFISWFYSGLRPHQFPN